MTQVKLYQILYRFAKVDISTSSVEWSPGSNHHLYVIRESGKYPHVADW